MDDLEHILGKAPAYMRELKFKPNPLIEKLGAEMFRESVIFGSSTRFVEYDPRDYENEEQRAKRIRLAEEAVDRAWERNRDSAPHSWS